jgi:hypothetical protein
MDPFAPPILTESAVPPARPWWTALSVAVHVFFYASAALIAVLVFIYWLIGVVAWLVVVSLPAWPGFLAKCAFVLAGLLGVAALIPAAEFLWNLRPEWHPYWPLAVAAAVPVPLAILIDRVFFRPRRKA